MMTLSEVEKDFLERINQALEAYAEPGYLSFMWTESELLEPDSQILRLARNVHEADKVIWGQRAEDPFTGLWSRNVVWEFLKQAIQKSQETDARTTCIVLLDIDHMKRLNDFIGHSEGDNSILKIAEVLKKHLQPWHFVGRVGGDEFLVVLNAPLEETRALMEKIHTEIAAMVFAFEARVTVSISFTQITLEDTFESCLFRLEDKLHYAKHTRRNDIWVV